MQTIKNICISDVQFKPVLKQLLDIVIYEPYRHYVPLFDIKKIDLNAFNYFVIETKTIYTAVYTFKKFKDLKDAFDKLKKAIQKVFEDAYIKTLPALLKNNIYACFEDMLTLANRFEFK